MDSLSAFFRGQASRNQPLKVFDWVRAAEIIVERKAVSASAGLSDDWEYTGGFILLGGLPVKDQYTYLASTWATPELAIEGDIIPCFRMQSETPGWNAETKWPEEALEILAPSGKPNKKVAVK